MTTITALNVRLGMDVSNFSEGANLAKAETNRVAAIMRQSVPPAEKYKQELDLINRAFSETGKKSKEYANALAFLEKKHGQAAAAVSKTTAEVNKAAMANNSALSSIKQMAAAYLGFQTVTKSINLATQVEDATVAFEVLTGSVNDGKVLFDQVRDFAERSPITFANATQATRTMLSFGLVVQDVQKNLQMLSDVTGGNNERFKTLSLAFSQMSAAGRLMGQDLLQMINAGFNPLQQISKMTGESLVDLKKRMEDGAISSEEVRRAFEAATAEGGMFFGMTERLSQTVGGKLNIALSELEKKLAAAGQAMAPLLVTLLDAFNRLQPVLDAVVNLIDGISQGLGFAVAAITDLINSVTTFSVDTTAMNEFLDMLEKREQEKAAAAAEQVEREFDQKKRAAEELVAAEKKAAQEAAAAQRRIMEEQQAAAKKAFEENQKRIETELKARKKAAEEAQKARQRAEEAAQKAFQKELEDARKAALEFFEKRKQELDERRAAVAQGPGSGMEVGSAEAAKFAADAVNARIAQSAVPEDPVLLQRDVARKTAELLIAQREANAKAAIQIDLAKRQLAEMQENGFRRLR